MNQIWIPSIEVESAQGIREVSLFTRHLMNGDLFLTGEITEATANTFLLQILYLEKNFKEPITLYINSPGGSVNAGLLIYDVLKESSLTIHMVCTGMAASMAAIILSSGQKGRRHILPNSKVMIHEPLIEGGIGGSASSIKNISDSILQTRELTNKILADHTGKSIEEIDEATQYDHYMNAEEAVDFGICDNITHKIRVAS